MKKGAFCFQSILIIITLLVMWVIPGAAETNHDDADLLAKQLANPIASLISVPFQVNYDKDIGPASEGERYTINVQPVTPFELSDKWNLIVRTIIPLIDQKDILPDSGVQAGLGDIVQTYFFSPRPGPNSVIWGVGPVFLWPTATDDLLGTEKWGAGPSAVLLKQTGPLTIGGLANHIESYAGAGGRNEISSTYLNPFISTIFDGGWTLGTQLEHTFDYENDQDTGVASVFLSKVLKLGDQDLSFGVVPKYWYKDSDSSPEGWAIRCTLTLMFPR